MHVNTDLLEKHSVPFFTQKPKFISENVNSRSRSLYAIARPSVVCRLSVCLLSVVCKLVRAPYSDGPNFQQYFYGVRYLGHENFTEIIPGEPLRRGS